jgi:hypothetical protein
MDRGLHHATFAVNAPVRARAQAGLGIAALVLGAASLIVGVALGVARPFPESWVCASIGVLAFVASLVGGFTSRRRKQRLSAADLGFKTPEEADAYAKAVARVVERAKARTEEAAAAERFLTEIADEHRRVLEEMRRQ